MHKVFSVYSNNPNDINHKNLHDEKKEIKNKFENLQAEHLEEMIKQVEISDDLVTLVKLEITEALVYHCKLLN